MELINKDLLYEIFKFLPVNDYPNICLCSKSFSEGIKQDKLWKYKCEQDCWSFYDNNKNDYYECYKLFHQLTKIKNKLHLKESIKEILNLKILEVNLMKIKEIPKEMGILKELEHLNFANNEIKEIPKELTNLKI